jgi:hypothetical protein
MVSNKSLVTSAIFTITFSLLLLTTAAPSRAQDSAPPDESAHSLGAGEPKAHVAPDSVAIDQPAIGDSAASSSPQADTSRVDDAWHLSVSPYLWFPGVHGTAVGPRGNGLGFRASPSDLLSNFRFGLMGAVEARHKWLVTSIDMMWIRLEDDKARAFPGLGVITANMKASEFLLTPKVGVRVINQEKFKIDALAGFRFWHFGERLNFNPSALGLNFSGSQNFVDPVVGGRIQMALSPKIVVNILGDVGGWGTGSQLEYQWAGLLGYKIKPALTLQAGYRYLNVDYRGSRGVVFNATTAGAVFGATLNLK